MTRQTLAADVLDALMTTWRADATLATYVTANRLRIFDGPPTTDRASEIELWVGATGLQADEVVVSGSLNQTAFTQTLDTEEALDIACAIWVANGTNDISTARRTCIDVFNAAATAVIGSNLGITEIYSATDVPAWELRQGQWPSGVGAVLAFTVRVLGQI